MVQEITWTRPETRRLAAGKHMGFLLIERGSIHWGDSQKAGVDTLLLCRPGHTLEINAGRTPVKAFWVLMTQAQIRQCSTEQTDLSSAFAFNPQPVVTAHPRGETLMLLKSLAMQLLRLRQKPAEYADDLLEQATREMFLAMAVQSFLSQDPHCGKPAKPQQNQFSLDEVFRYIHTHLTEELTLEVLEKEFYISRGHLIRQFKKRTGQTVHSYILRCRLDLSRTLMEQGYSINEASRMGGFGCYNHFFKAFRKAYGMTPREYCKQHLEESQTES